jgi:hypothetical protein
VDEASWVPIEEAAERASYKGDKRIIEKAKEMISEHVRKNP